MPAIPLLDRAASATASVAESLLHRRQNGLYDPTALFGKTAGPAPGVVAGIVLGSVAGFLLLIWLIALMMGASFAGNFITGEEEIVVRRGSRSPRSSHRSRGGGTVRTMETREISRSPNRRRRSASQGGTRIVEERIRRTERDRRVDGDDIVEVFEEASSDGAPRRQRSRRNSNYRLVEPFHIEGREYEQRRTVSVARRSSNHSRQDL
jgi:hypothetical protein